MIKFPTKIIEGHLVTDLYGAGVWTIFDTGSPVSFGEIGEFLGYPVLEDGNGTDIQTLNSLTNFTANALIGMDILSNYNLLFAQNELLLSENAIDFEGEFSPIKNFMGIPVMEICVGGQPLSCFVDSGAKISYISSNLTEGMTSVETRQDYYPLYGHFETPIFRVDIDINGCPLNVAFGNLPKKLEGLLLMLSERNTGILGSDLFQNFRVYLDFDNMRIGISKN